MPLLAAEKGIDEKKGIALMSIEATFCNIVIYV
jgi:hypothetical protein